MPQILSDHHLRQLTQGSGIAPDLIAERGYCSLTHPDDVQDLGFSKAQARTTPVLAIPLWDVHGRSTGWQIRPDSPRQFKDGTVPKYEQPKGSRLILDVHPRVQPLLANPKAPLWLTEGVKKGDALASRGVCAIALNGVWGFKGTNEHGGKTLLVDWEYVALNDRVVYVVFDSDIYQKPAVEQALKALYAFLRSKQAIPCLVQWPEAYRQSKVGVDDFLVQGHTLEDLLAMVPPRGPLPPKPPRSNSNGQRVEGDERALPYSDYTNALAFVREHGEKVRYCYPWKSWLVWTGTHWERDTSGQVMQMAKQTITRLVHRLDDLGESEAKVLLEHVKASLSTGKLKAMIESAQSEPGIPTQPDVWDANPWLLNCVNGTLDLKTGKLQSHQRADYLSKCLTIEYDPEATCPAWEQFLWRIMGGSQEPDHPDMGCGELENRRQADARAGELIAFLQRAAGYTLTGSTQEQCLFLCHGPTKTGKSTYLATIRALLGPYGKQADIQTFMHKDRPEVRNDLADLAGARYVYAVESQEGKRLAEHLVKQMTGGGDALKARFLFEEYFEFKPQFKAYIGTNHKPIIKDSDDAIWERIRLVPFTVQIPKEERDKTLEEKLLQELPGILAWAVRGCLAWQKSKDLKEPTVVVTATQGYRDEMDSVARFLDECCRFHEQFRIKAGDLHAAFVAWCEGSGIPSMTLKEFGRRLDDKGIEKKTSNFVWRVGLTLQD